MRLETDILIAGGGIAGMVATLLFAKAGFEVICVDAGPVPGPAEPSDLRSTAYLMPAIRLLEGAGLMEKLTAHAGRLRIMRLVDAGGAVNEIREVVDFTADEVGEAQFGWNIPNARMRAALIEAISSTERATLHHAVSVKRATARSDDALVMLSNGDQVRTRLVIGADGRDSAVREGAGIDAHRIRYGQKAVVFMVSHPQRHDGVSTEIHRTGGPFTLVPLAGESEDRSAVVWMDKAETIDTLAALDDDAFAMAATERSCDVLGPLTLTSPRAVWPIISQKAAKLTAPRLALIGEAAHVVPPIGAQGLNMSLADIATLRDVALGKDPGAPEVLDAYARARATDMRLRVTGIDLLNRAAMTETGAFRDLRRLGLKLIGNTPIKQPLMRMGLGVGR